MWKIKKELIEDIIQGSISTNPNEFVSLLGGNLEQKIIEELIVPQATMNPFSATINTAQIPFNAGVIGSIHSHPGFSNNPSLADKKFFKRYSINLIICKPFSTETISAYDSTSKELNFKIT